MEEDNNKDTDDADDDEEEENFPCNLTNGLSLWLEQLTIPPNITKMVSLLSNVCTCTNIFLFPKFPNKIHIWFDLQLRWE